MALVGPTDIALGAVTATIPISPPTPTYQVMPTASWNTVVSVSQLTNINFTVVFSDPAPAGAQLFWAVETLPEAPGGQLKSLGDYLDELNDLLHDPQNQYWTQPQKIKYINSAIQQRDLDSGQNRQLFRFTTTIGQDTYTFAELQQQNPAPPSGPTLAGPGVVFVHITLNPPIAAYQVTPVSASWNTIVFPINLAPDGFDLAFSAPAPPTGGLVYWQLAGFGVTTTAAQVFDVIGINLLYNNLRYVMGTMSFSELNATVRQYNPPLTWAPVRWARYGPNTVIFGPAPSIAYVTEWDCSVYSSPLVNLTDFDLLPYPYTKPVPYYAAYKAKLNERQYDEAESFKELYTNELAHATDSRVGMVTSMYANDASIVRLS